MWIVLCSESEENESLGQILHPAGGARQAPGAPAPQEGDLAHAAAAAAPAAALIQRKADSFDSNGTPPALWMIWNPV